MEIFSPIWLRQKRGFSRDSWDIPIIYIYIIIYIIYSIAIYISMIEDDEIKGRRPKKQKTGLLSQLFAFFGVSHDALLHTHCWHATN